MGNVPLVTPWVAAGDGPRRPGARGAAPGGRPGRQAPSSLASETSPGSSGGRFGTRGGLTPSCWSTSGRAWEGAAPRGDGLPPLRTGARGLPASGSLACGTCRPGAGPALPPTLQRILLTRHLPSLGVPCFPAEPKLRVGLTNKWHQKTRMPWIRVLCELSQGDLSQRRLCLGWCWQRLLGEPRPRR